MTKTIFFLGMLFSFLLPVKLASAGEGPLPLSWYSFPESGLWSEREESAEPSRAAADSMERILRAHSLGLDKLSEAEERNPKLSRSADDWKFQALILDLSVAASGTMGVMMAKGEAAAALYWRRKAEAGSINADTDLADLSFSGADSRARVQEKLEPVIRAVLATGDVKDEAELRKNLITVVLGYQALVQNVAWDPGREWYVSKLRLDFTVDVSGKVNPAMTVGGNVRLRFEWEPSARTEVLQSNSGENLKKLIETLSQEMKTVSYEALAPTGFKVKSLKFALGIFGDGKFGVVKVGASVFGHLYLSKRDIVHPVQLPTAPVLESIPLLDARNVYQIPKETFRKGLEKAVKIGTWLAERSRKSEGKKWELYLLKTEFALSLAGSVGLVTLGGTGSIEIAFDKPAI